MTETTLTLQALKCASCPVLKDTSVHPSAVNGWHDTDIALTKIQMSRNVLAAILTCTQVPLGSVTPLALANPSALEVLLLLDIRIKDQVAIFVHPLVNTSSLALSPSAFDAALRYCSGLASPGSRPSLPGICEECCCCCCRQDSPVPHRVYETQRPLPALNQKRSVSLAEGMLF